MASRTFTVYRTHHGPIVRAADGKWISVRLMEKPVEALSQSFLRTKARTLAEYRKVMELHANSSNNTVYADADGHIAYFHPQFVPRRDDRVRLDPAGGRQRSGDRLARRARRRRQPARGRSAERLDPEHQQLALLGGRAGQPEARRDFPTYMDQAGESPRGLHAIRVLEDRKDFTLDRLRDAAFDSYLTGVRAAAPAAARRLRRAAGGRLAQGAGWPSRSRLLRAWDYRWSASSVPTSLAVYWGDALMDAHARRGRRRGHRGLRLHGDAGRRREQKLEALGRGDRTGCTRDFGTLEDAVGRDQPVPAAHRRHRAAVRRRRPEHPGAVHLGAVGLARVVRRADLSGDEADVRHRAATASWRWWSSARTACGRGR